MSLSPSATATRNMWRSRLPRIALVFLAGFSITAAIALASASLAQDGQAEFTPRDEAPEEFPDRPGREEAFYFCGACHNFRLVAQQGQSRGQWEETLDFMTERHNMPKLEGDDRKAIVDYLASAFPQGEPSGGGWQNPFLNQ